MANTPWGQSQYSNKHFRGCITYSTASHGGIKVSPTTAKLLSEYTKNYATWVDRQGYWYEEDQDYLLPLYELQDHPGSDFSSYRKVSINQIKAIWEDYPECSTK